MTAIIKQYDITSIQNIITNGSCSLLPEIQNIITTLGAEFFEPVDIPQPIRIQRVNSSFERNKGGGGRKGNGRMKSPKPSSENLESMMNDWEAVRNFKATEKINREGVDKVLCEIRVSLNKLSSVNYSEKKDAVVELILTACSTESEYLQPVVDCIFEIMSSNRFISNVYADLYEELIGANECFGNKLNGYLEFFTDAFDVIKYVDPDEDYDGFCKYNKANELQRANATFISNLMIRDMISRVEVMNLILMLQTRAIQYIDEPDKKVDVENLTECIFVFVKACRTTLTEEPGWKIIETNVERFTKMKVKEHTSLSSRCIFKYMDMM